MTRRWERTRQRLSSDPRCSLHSVRMRTSVAGCPELPVAQRLLVLGEMTLVMSSPMLSSDWWRGKGLLIRGTSAAKTKTQTDPERHPNLVQIGNGHVGQAGPQMMD